VSFHLLNLRVLHVIITDCSKLKSTVFWYRQLQSIQIIFRENYSDISGVEMQNILRRTNTVSCCIKGIWVKLLRNMKV